MILRTFLVVLCLLQGSFGYAQDPVYTHYDVSAGLPGNIVYCAAQDENGLMWFGTDKGLTCFDGVRFHNYGVAEGLPDPEVLNLKTDSKGRLWISCFKRKPCYRYQGKFHTEFNDSLINSINLKSAMIDFFEEEGKGVWMIGYSEKVVFWDDTRGSAQLHEWFPKVGAIQGLGRIDGQLLGVEQGRITLLNDTKNTLHIPFGSKILTQKLEDCMIEGRMIIVSIEDYTEIFSYQEGNLKALNKIKGWGGRLYLDKNSNLWISSNRFGCVRFDQFLEPKGKQTVYLPDKKINQFFEDRSGGKWFLTSGEGIYYLPVFHATQFNTSNGTISNNITSLSYDERGIWFGDDESNIYNASNGKMQLWSSISTPGLNRIRGIAGMNETNVVASDRGGFWVTKTNATYIPTSAAAKYVLPLWAGQYCVGSSSKVMSVSLQTGSSSTIYPWRTTAATLDIEGRLWLGAIDGMYSVSDSFSRNWAETFPELKSRIVAMANARTRGIWVATSTDGLFLLTLNKEGIEKITKINNLLFAPVNNIQSLFVDNSERVWMATNNGVYCLDKQFKITSYNRNNGISANDVNAVIMVKDTLWAATVAGLTKLPIKGAIDQPDFPSLISECHYKIRNTDVKMNLLDSVSGHPQIVLDPECSLIEVGFGGIDYNSAKNLRFLCLVEKCMLPLPWLTFDNLISQIRDRFEEKTDSIQSEAAGLNFGVNLPAGRYKVTVFAVNAAGKMSTQPDWVTITKIPYWYQTLWVHLCIWVLVMFMLYRFSRVFGENRRLMMRVSELRLQAIKLQINPHFIGNSINAIQQFFFPPDFRKANAYIEIFTRLLRTTMEHAEETFYPIEQEITYLDDYLKMTHLRFGDKFSYEIDIDPELSRSIPFPVMLLQPLVENATIHGLASGKPSFLSVHFSRQQDRVVCTILDNGPGLNKTREINAGKKGHTSKGLALTYNKIDALNELHHIQARLELTDVTESSQGKHGTCAVFSYQPK
ncbi:MAG TPA: two-component regulator propeller domain-containing protein [Saprospiraceae bacterium]|nr:two-component regulator propeller domain-containing protein [Saprospiraceae bacterium]